MTDTENKVKQQADRHEHELFEIESLRTVVVALTQKLKAQSVQDVTITNLNEQLTLSENARLALQQQLGQLTSEVITRGE